MKALGVFHTRGKAATARPGAIWQTALHTTWITQGSSCLAWLVMGAVLSQTRIGGQCAPFGLGLVGAAGAGVGGLFSLMGVSLGAVAAMGLVDGLRIAAAAVLIYAVAFAVYDTRLYQARWLMPLAAACLDGTTGIVYLAEGNWLATEITSFGLEAVLAGGAAWCFHRGLFPRGIRDRQTSDLTVLLREERVRDPVQIRCLLVLGAALLSGLSRYAVAELSPARILALTGVLILGAYRSPEAGVCVGVLFGLAVDLPQAGTPCCTVLYCLSGMAAGFLTKRRKPLCMLAAVGSAVLLSVTWQENAAVLPVEAFCSAAVFALLPRRLFRRLRAAENHLPTPQAAPAMAQVQEQLEAQASAFRSIYDHLQVALSEAPGESVSSMQLFARAADRVCVNCAKQNRCWRQEYGVTKAALTKCAPRLLERGRGVRSDFDRSFTDRCDHFPAFLTAVNQEVSNLLAQRQFQARVRENRAEVCRQYGELARLLSGASVQLGLKQDRDERRTRHLEEYLSGKRLPARGCVARDRRGHLYVELFGSDLIPLDKPELIEAISGLLMLPLRRGSLFTGMDGQRLTLRQREPYAISAGIAALPRGGNSVSGDTCRWYKGEDGILWVILCDGMGCGRGAARESRLVLRLLEDLLKAEVDPEEALRTICGAMSLRGELGGGFSTIDLLAVDLFSCQAELYKLGAAPTYIRRGQRVSRISGDGLPAGAVGGGQTPEVTRCTLEVGDVLLLVSDGISDGQEDEWLKKALIDGGNLDSKALALAILQLSCKHAGTRDDQTAVVLRLSERRSKLPQAPQKGR